MRMILSATLAIAPRLLAKGKKPVKRLNESDEVFSEVEATPDKGIPQDLLANAHCIGIVPSLKTVAFVVGGKYGKSCRNESGVGLSAPGSGCIEGSSIGFQIGGSTTDLICAASAGSGEGKHGSITPEKRRSPF